MQMNGFAIGDDSHPASVEEQDRRDSENLYNTLTQKVIPLFFERDENGIPRQWIQMIRRAMVVFRISTGAFLSFILGIFWMAI